MQGVNRSKGCLWSRINARMIKARSRETPGKMKSAGREDRCPAQHTAPPHSVSCTGAGRDAARSLSRTCLAKQHRCPADSSRSQAPRAAPHRTRRVPQRLPCRCRQAGARPRGQGAIRQRRCSWAGSYGSEPPAPAGCVLGSSTGGFLLQKAPREEGL